jgi:hypothetical protein
LELFKKELEYFKTLGDREKSLIQYIFSKSNDVNVKFLQDLLFPLFTTNPIDFDNFQHLILTEI